MAVPSQLCEVCMAKKKPAMRGVWQIFFCEVRMQAGMHVCSEVRKYGCMDGCLHVCIHTCVYVVQRRFAIVCWILLLLSLVMTGCVCLYVCVCVCVCVCALACTRTQVGRQSEM